MATATVNRIFAAAIGAAIAVCGVVGSHADVVLDEEARPTRSFVGNYLAGRHAVRQRDKDAAALFLGAALQQSPEDVSLLDQAFVAALSAGEYDEAVRYASDLLKTDAGNRLARITVAADALRARRYQQVSKILDGAFENPLAKITGTFLNAWAQVGAGKAQPALAMIQEMDDLDNADIRRIKDYALGLVAEFDGNHERALAAYQRAFDKQIVSVRVVQALARAAAKAGDFDLAREVAQAYEDRAPGNVLIGRYAQGDRGGARPLLPGNDAAGRAPPRSSTPSAPRSAAMPATRWR